VFETYVGKLQVRGWDDFESHGTRNIVTLKTCKGHTRTKYNNNNHHYYYYYYYYYYVGLLLLLLVRKIKNQGLLSFCFTTDHSSGYDCNGQESRVA
jgi:hypothetical protein